MQLVDLKAPELLQIMQSKGIHLMAMTKRNPELSQLTIDALSAFQIDFSKTAPVKELIHLPFVGNTVCSCASCIY